MVNNKNVSSTVGHADCCGCKLCGESCPQKCISFKQDNEGFTIPVIDDNSCTNCGICSKLCPELNQTFHSEAPCAISAYSKNQEIHEEGSSGGVYGILALHIIAQGGKVYGAAFDNDLHLMHVGIEDSKDLLPLCKSKYLQSDCAGIYKQVKDDLKEGRKVLFCGTPCQCQAISNYVGKNRDNLFIVDFACHGVSCQPLFDENIARYGRKIGTVESYKFRAKKTVKYHHTFKIQYFSKAKYHQTFILNTKKKDGSTTSRIGTYYKDPYYYGYEKRFTLRKSCYSCKWARSQRCSDLTMSDFFGIAELNPAMKEKYVSCIFCNTEKGRNLYEAVKDNLSGVGEYAVADAARNNECLRHPMKMPSHRDQFFAEWRQYGFDAVVEKYLTPKHRWVYDIYYAIPSIIRKLIRKYL